jgi:hypothetical protein
MNPASQKLITILDDGVADEICISAAELADSVDLDPGQQLTWLASTWRARCQVHIFFCESDSEDDDEEFINTRHDERGRLLEFSGPFASYAEAKRMAGPTSEGWTEV